MLVYKNRDSIKKMKMSEIGRDILNELNIEYEGDEPFKKAIEFLKPFSNEELNNGFTELLIKRNIIKFEEGEEDVY